MPAPVLVRLPEPEIVPPKLKSSSRLKISEPLLVTVPEIEPEVPPFPICKVPALIVVPPL
ncbi:hypothetical protein BTHI11S_06332 [Bosea thiooxidans]